MLNGAPARLPHRACYCLAGGSPALTQATSTTRLTHDGAPDDSTDPSGLFQIPGRPKRLLEDMVAVATESGVMRGRARVVDSTPIYDAVSTQDTVTQLRAAIRKLLMVLRPELAVAVRAVLERDDDYATPGKPPCDWDDPAAREALNDELVRDGLAALEVLDGVKDLTKAEQDAVDVLAVVVGQDVDLDDDGVFRIFDGTVKDRMISTVDTEARHGHKSQNATSTRTRRTSRSTRTPRSSKR